MFFYPIEVKFCNSSPAPRKFRDFLNGYRIGGPDACIPQPHSTPWLARLMLDGTKEELMEGIPDKEYIFKNAILPYNPAREFNFRLSLLPNLGDPYSLHSHSCGGALISKNLVITAAHCLCYKWERIAKNSRGIYEVPSKTPECSRWKKMSVFLGDHDIEHMEGEQKFKMKNVMIHDKFPGSK